MNDERKSNRFSIIKDLVSWEEIGVWTSKGHVLSNLKILLQEKVGLLGWKFVSSNGADIS